MHKNKTKENKVGEKKNILKKCLTIIEKELLAEKVKEYLALFDKTVKGYKEKVVL